MLPLRPDGRRGHLHVLVLERALGAEAELDLVGERDLERVALHVRPELALPGLDRCQIAAVAARERPWRRRTAFWAAALRALGAQAPVAGESPGAVHEHAHADPLGLAVVEPFDALVARADDLGPANDHSSVGVARPRTESRGHSLLAELSHRAYLSTQRPARERRSYNPATRWWRNW